MRSEQEANRAIELYADTVRRICMVHLKNHADTEDIFQNVFLKYVMNSTEFEKSRTRKGLVYPCNGQRMQRSAEKLFPQPNFFSG